MAFSVPLAGDVETTGPSVAGPNGEAHIRNVRPWEMPGMPADGLRHHRPDAIAADVGARRLSAGGTDGAARAAPSSPDSSERLASEADLSHRCVTTPELGEGRRGTYSAGGGMLPGDER